MPSYWRSRRLPRQESDEVTMAAVDQSRKIAAGEFSSRLLVLRSSMGVNPCKTAD
ncbi:MAG: hypothetical protein ACYCYO_05355 [Bacilli bacterium]